MRQDDAIAEPVEPVEPAEPAEPAQMDAHLRAQLGRRLVVALVLADAESSAAVQSAIQRFRAQVAAYKEVWEPPCQSADATVEAALRNALTFDADAILVWVDWSQAGAPFVQPQSLQPLPPKQRAALRIAPHTASARGALALAEQSGALDRCFVVLIGQGVTRPNGRALGYEDGYSADEPVGPLIAALAREALARESYRRQGSSPPCYL